MPEEPNTGYDRRISLLEQSSDQLTTNMAAANTKLDLILAQITRVAVLEEKHQAQQVDVSRAHDRVTDVETTINALAIETRAFIAYLQGRDKVLWAIGVAVLSLSIKALFFTATLGFHP